jgi:hypothetical protein
MWPVVKFTAVCCGARSARGVVEEQRAGWAIFAVRRHADATTVASAGGLVSPARRMRREQPGIVAGLATYCARQ